MMHSLTMYDINFRLNFIYQRGPKKVFGILKKRQETGLGKIMQKYSTKLVDLNLATGIFQYVSKDGGKLTSFAFRVSIFINKIGQEIEEIFVRYVNEDPDCPKDFPFSFSFRVRKIKDQKEPSNKFRDYTFACIMKEERD